MWFNYARELGTPDRRLGRAAQHQLSPGSPLNRYSEEAEIYYKGGVEYLQGRLLQKETRDQLAWSPGGMSNGNTPASTGLLRAKQATLSTD